MTLKKSEFITLLYRVFTLEEIQAILKQVHKEHPKATHVCTAYRIAEREASNDDGEPSGTAGLPMLEVLRQKDIGDILAVVVRYYGGIPLGASGLTRAYRSCVADTLNESELNRLVEVSESVIEVPLPMADLFLSRVPEWGTLVKRQFGETLILTVQSKTDIVESVMALSKGQAVVHTQRKLWIEEKKDR